MTVTHPIRYDHIALSCCATYGLHNLRFEGCTTTPNKAQREAAYKDLMHRVVGSSPILLASPVNYKSKTRREKDFVTADFVNWLIENKIGMVTASPVFANPNYSLEPESISLCQIWVWCPPSMLEKGFVLADSAGIHNEPGGAYQGLQRHMDTMEVDKLDDLLAPKYAKLPQYSKARETWEKHLQKKQALKKTG